MTKQDLHFFKGVVITAQHVLSGLLYSDAVQLASISTQKQSARKINVAPIDQRTALAVTWVDSRRRRPKGTLEASIIVGATDLDNIEPSALKFARIAALLKPNVYADTGHQGQQARHQGQVGRPSRPPSPFAQT